MKKMLFQLFLHGHLCHKGGFFLDSLQWIDWTHLSELLLLPICILVASLSIGIIINRMVNQRIMRHVAGIDEDSFAYIVIKALHGVPISLSLVVGLYWIVKTSNLPAPIEKIFSYILFAVIVFTITRIMERALSRLIELKLSSGNAEQSTLLSMIFKAVVYATGILVILQHYDISITPIITALGVGGMAIAFGLQETLANIFAGLQLILSRQVRVGDYIRLNTGDEGKVTDINWRFTTVVPTTRGSEVIIPNKTIAGSITTNYSRPREDIVITIPVGVAYDSDLEHVERVTLEVATQVMKQVDGYKPHLDKNGKDTSPMAPTVRFHTFADSSIDFNVLLHSSRFDHQVILKHEFIKALTKRYRKENIDIPFPIRTIIQSYPQKN